MSFCAKKTSTSIICSIRRSGQFISNTYGIGRGQIWLDGVACTGRETDFTQCGHNGWGSHDCDHYEDVAISCDITRPPTGVLLILCFVVKDN